MFGEPKGLFFLCCYCKTELNESQLFKFREGVGCEQCVRDYYRDRSTEIEYQLKARRESARTWLERNRKELEKQATRRRSTHY